MKLSTIRIPACQQCNNEYLSSCIENPIAQGSRSYEDALRVPSNVWGSWAAKIFYGIYLRGNALRANVRDPSSPPLIPREFVLSINQVRVLSLLSAPVFELLPPDLQHSTVALLPCKVQIPQPRVEFIDLPQLQALALRLGSVGAIVCLGDGGLTERVLAASSFYRDYTQRPLTPYDFRTAAAMVFYQRSRLTWTPEPSFLEVSPGKFACMINTMTLSFSALQSRFRSAGIRAMFASVFQLPLESVSYSRSKGIRIALPLNHPLADGALDA